MLEATAETLIITGTHFKSGEPKVRVKTPSGVEEFKAVWMDDGFVQMIDQRALPHTFEIFRAETSDEIAFAIKDMVVRGAPAIGAAAAYGIALSIIPWCS